MGPTQLLSLLFVLVLTQISTNILASIENPVNETDQIALVSIKTHLVDRPNGVLTSWNTSVHYCEWEGVTCNRKNNRVTTLDLNTRGLSGTISPFVGNLSFLESILLNNNSLYGQIPTQIGHLSKLQVLRLDTNTLSGEIPANLSSCTDLRQLFLAANNIHGNLPVELKALSKLEILYIYKNNLTGPLFDVISNLTSLQKIVTYQNGFTGTIPNSIGRMRNLSNFNIGNNLHYGPIPASIYNLSSLYRIDLVNSQFYGELPPDIGVKFPRLTWLNLFGNNFSGSIPITLLNLTNMGLIELGENSFTGRVPQGFGYLYNLFFLGLSGNILTGDISFISTLVNCTELQVIDFRMCGFPGELPESVGNLSTSLLRLGLGGNPITERIPAGITNLISLNLLDMTACNFTGALPQDFGKLQNLQSVFLDSNGLTGHIPSSIGNLPRLSELYLQGNKLEGSIPRSLGNCESLLYLNLSYNQLNGTLASELLKGTAQFVELDLSYNQLEGSIPAEIKEQTRLGKFILSRNKFTGLIPDGLSESTALQKLYMDSNFFHGVIPSSFVALASLQKIDFSHNNLSGQIPAFLSKFPLLSYLNLSYNDFEGRVPANAVFANASDVFLVGNRRLCGGIPVFRLPKCVENESVKRKKRTVSPRVKLLLIVISAISAIVVLAIGLYLIVLRKKKTPVSSDAVMGKEFMKVSYNMLLKAINGFSSDNLLGSGSFGSVYKGTLEEKTVAIKVLNLQHHGASKSFMAECNTLRNVRHRNLAGIITACASIDFQGNDFRALVYEFMPNGSLDRWLNGSENISLIQRVDVAIDVASALNYLHNECENPIVHRDLKPSNVLLDDDMVAHVGDFGLAKFLIEPSRYESSTIGIRGTTGYAAPEYGLGSEASTEGDLYSYGILLIELMTGKRPTDNMFKEDRNLHTYAKEALPDNVLQVVDPKLEYNDITEAGENRSAVQDALQGLQRRVECIVSIVSIGVACSNHSPQNRMKIINVVSRLRVARDNLLNTRRRSDLPTRRIQ